MSGSGLDSKTDTPARRCAVTNDIEEAERLLMAGIGVGIDFEEQAKSRMFRHLYGGMPHMVIIDDPLELEATLNPETGAYEVASAESEASRLRKMFFAYAFDATTVNALRRKAEVDKPVARPSPDKPVWYQGVPRNAKRGRRR